MLSQVSRVAAALVVCAQLMHASHQLGGWTANHGRPDASSVQPSADHPRYQAQQEIPDTSNEAGLSFDGWNQHPITSGVTRQQIGPVIPITGSVNQPNSDESSLMSNGDSTRIDAAEALMDLSLTDPALVHYETVKDVRDDCERVLTQLMSDKHRVGVYDQWRILHILGAFTEIIGGFSKCDLSQDWKKFQEERGLKGIFKSRKPVKISKLRKKIGGDEKSEEWAEWFGYRQIPQASRMKRNRDDSQPIQPDKRVKMDNEPFKFEDSRESQINLRAQDKVNKLRNHYERQLKKAIQNPDKYGSRKLYRMIRVLGWIAVEFRGFTPDMLEDTVQDLIDFHNANEGDNIDKLMRIYNGKPWIRWNELFLHIGGHPDGKRWKEWFGYGDQGMTDDEEDKQDREFITQRMLEDWDKKSIWHGKTAKKPAMEQPAQPPSVMPHPSFTMPQYNQQYNQPYPANQGTLFAPADSSSSLSALNTVLPAHPVHAHAHPYVTPTMIQLYRPYFLQRQSNSVWFAPVNHPSIGSLPPATSSNVEGYATGAQ